jgi:hypothetical protein
MAKRSTIPLWLGAIVGIVVFGLVIWGVRKVAAPSCPGSYIYCPGVGCVSGPDKCFPGERGGASKTFSHETFKEWPGTGVKSTPPEYGGKERFVDKQCPDGTRTDGPCLMEF